MEPGIRQAAKSFTDLVVWQKAHQFVLAVYRLTKNFPCEETYGLTSQFRRSAVSIAANIAEGFRKRGSADKLRFFNIAQGSAEELILAGDLGFGGDPKAADLMDEVGLLMVDFAKCIVHSGD